MVANRSWLYTWLMLEWCTSPIRLGWLWTTTYPTNVGCACNLRQHPGEVLPIQRGLKRPFPPPVCSPAPVQDYWKLSMSQHTVCSITEVVWAWVISNVLPRFQGARSFQMCARTQQQRGLDYGFAQLPSNGKVKQNLTFLYWKSGKALEQAAQGSNGVVRPTGKASFKVPWCLSFAEKSERKRNLLISHHWIDVLQQDLHEHPHTQNVVWCV